MSDTTHQTAPKTPDQITADVLASFDGCRRRAAARDHAGARRATCTASCSEVGLTPEEWEAAIGILTATGHITDERRQEFILWSDSLGVSMLVDALANPVPEGATESTVLGPFYVPGVAAARVRREHRRASPTPAMPAWVHGRVLDLDGRPIAGAELDVWQNGDDQLYAVQRPEAPEDHLRGPLPHARRRQLRVRRGPARAVPDPRTTARWAGCSTSPAVIRGAPPTST